MINPNKDAIELLRQEIDIPDVVRSKVNAAFEKIRIENESKPQCETKTERIRKPIRKSRHFRKIVIAVGSMAAILVIAFAICAANPVKASQIPIIGHLFAQVQEHVPYKGDFSSHARQLTEDPNDMTYVQTSNGITMTISEVAYSSEALYMAVTLEKPDGFPEELMTKGHDGNPWLLMGECKLSFVNDENGEPVYSIPSFEGKFEDANTFVGIAYLNLDIHSPGATPEEIEAAGIEDPVLTEEQKRNMDAAAFAAFDDYSAKVQEAFPDAYQKIAVPEQFTYDLNLTEIMEQFHSGSTEPADTIENDPNIKCFYGQWNFHLDVSIDISENQIAQVNETNPEGLGITKVTKTPYEITADKILPPGKVDASYYMVICDAKGDYLENQGNTNVYQTYGRDTSKVYIYICDDYQYMRELKGYHCSQTYEEDRKTMTAAQYLAQYALYKTEVTFND